MFDFTSLPSPVANRCGQTLAVHPTLSRPYAPLAHRFNELVRIHADPGQMHRQVAAFFFNGDAKSLHGNAGKLSLDIRRCAADAGKTTGPDGASSPDVTPSNVDVDTDINVDVPNIDIETGPDIVVDTDIDVVTDIDIDVVTDTDTAIDIDVVVDIDIDIDVVVDIDTDTDVDVQPDRT